MLCCSCIDRTIQMEMEFNENNNIVSVMHLFAIFCFFFLFFLLFGSVQCITIWHLFVCAEAANYYYSCFVDCSPFSVRHIVWYLAYRWQFIRLHTSTNKMWKKNNRFVNDADLYHQWIVDSTRRFVQPPSFTCTGDDDGDEKWEPTPVSKRFPIAFMMRTSNNHKNE